MGDEQRNLIHTRWTKKIDRDGVPEHVYLSTDGHGNWGVTHSWVFPDAITAHAWAKGIVERDCWVDYSSDRTGFPPPS